jgi:hypothetical protein
MSGMNVWRVKPLTDIVASVAPNGVPATDWSVRRCCAPTRRFREVMASKATGDRPTVVNETVFHHGVSASFSVPRRTKMDPQNNPYNHCLDNTRSPDVNSEFNLLNANLMASACCYFSFSPAADSWINY